MTTKTAFPANFSVCQTVYSVVWPDTEDFVRQTMKSDMEAMLDLHRDAHTKRQDGMHEPFFDAWVNFASSAVNLPVDLVERYPTAGSSEAIREIIREATWKDQDLVIFDGEYEGYEAIAQAQGTRVHRIDRNHWREELEKWNSAGAPWGTRSAQFWISQPSAIDGNTWPDFQAWLASMEAFPACQVWVDLTYVGRARIASAIDLCKSSVLAGVVFSLSKVMGAYYRRMGGCISRQPVPGLWANRWFKHLDSLYLGQKWLARAQSALAEGEKYVDVQRLAMVHAYNQLEGTQWSFDLGQWQPSDVSLLMHAVNPHHEIQQPLWIAAARGVNNTASRRLCLTPAIVALLSKEI